MTAIVVITFPGVRFCPDDPQINRSAQLSIGPMIRPKASGHPRQWYAVIGRAIDESSQERLGGAEREERARSLRRETKDVCSKKCFETSAGC